MSLGSGIRDPRSGIRNKPIPDPGSRGQKAPIPDPGSRIRIRNTAGMFIPDPGSWFLPIPDPGSRISDPGSRIQKQHKRERRKKLDVKPFYVAIKFNKIVYYFSFEVLKKKIWANFQRIIELFTKKIVKKFFKIWSWDPGSGIRKKIIPDPGSRGQKGTGSRIRIRNTVNRFT